MRDKRKLVLLWFFGLLFALTPIGFDLLHLLSQRDPPPLVSLIIHGEVIIIAIVILADTFIRAAGSDDTGSVRLPLMLGCVLVLLLLGYDAGQVREQVEATAHAFEDPFVVKLVLSHTTVAFLFSMILSLTSALTLED